MDVKDKQKHGVTLFGERPSNIEDTYGYEVIVFTGDRMNAGTFFSLIFYITRDLIKVTMGNETVSLTKHTCKKDHSGYSFFIASHQLPKTAYLNAVP